MVLKALYLKADAASTTAVEIDSGTGYGFFPDGMCQHRSLGMQEIVTLDSHRNGGFRALRALEAGYVPDAANIHIFRESDFRGHDQDHLYRRALFQLQGRPHKSTTRAEILRASGARAAISRNPQENRNLVGKSLAAAALNPALLVARHQQPI